MYKLKRFFKKLFTPVSIMMVPHDGKRTINIKVPSIGIVLSAALWLIGSLYVVSMAIDTIEYYNMKSSLDYYSSQFAEIKGTINTIQKAELEFKRILSFGSKGAILENVESKVNTQDAGSLDMEALKRQISHTVKSVHGIQTFLQQQRDLYHSTPMGWPISGRVTSEYGQRDNPKYGGREFHSGIDISAPVGTPVKSTAEGVVSFSGWSQGNGNLVVVEHGLGFSTMYAHNSALRVIVGQKVKRGEVLAYVGATGNTTGPHLHYEVWNNGKATNPYSYMREAHNVSKEK
ncbi:MAG: M23 family metallopeptidase [Nitrospirae bacterium]|nr:MAG: M23 family metallopeptidase [Nitrospirota bacterium]